MRRHAEWLMMLAGAALPVLAQQHMETHGESTLRLTTDGNGQVLNITNVTYEVKGGYVPGLPPEQLLLLRKTITSEEHLRTPVLDATTTYEAWPLGVDPKQKPLYTVKATGSGGETVDNALIVIDWRPEDFELWSVYRLGNGAHLFDTCVPLVSFSTSPDSWGVQTARYLGLDVPPDDTPDARLKRPEVVAVITYASLEQVKREVLLTCEDPKLAAEFRSYWDTTRKLWVTDERPPGAVELQFSGGYFHANPITLTIPLTHDDLDIAHAQLPPHLHLAVWKR